MSDLDEALADVRASGVIADAFPAIDAALGRADAAIERRVFLALQSEAGLAPQAAVQAWCEKASYHKLRQGLTKALKAGQNAGTRVASQMTPSGDDNG